jgi:hypothetical protein
MQIPRKGQSGKLLFGRMAFETLLFWDSVVTNATSLLSNPLHYELKRFWSGATEIHEVKAARPVLAERPDARQKSFG